MPTTLMVPMMVAPPIPAAGATTEPVGLGEGGGSGRRAGALPRTHRRRPHRLPNGCAPDLAVAHLVPADDVACSGSADSAVSPSRPPVARSGRYAQPGYQVPGPGRPAGPVAGGYGGPRRGPYVGGPQDIPWVPGGAQGYSGAQPTVPPAPPAASYGARGYGTQPSLRSGRRPAPSSGSDTSAIKVVGWVLIIIIFFLIRILTG